MSKAKALENIVELISDQYARHVPHDLIRDIAFELDQHVDVRYHLDVDADDQYRVIKIFFDDESKAIYRTVTAII